MIDLLLFFLICVTGLFVVVLLRRVARLELAAGIDAEGAVDADKASRPNSLSAKTQAKLNQIEQLLFELAIGEKADD